MDSYWAPPYLPILSVIITPYYNKSSSNMSNMSNMSNIQSNGGGSDLIILRMIMIKTKTI